MRTRIGLMILTFLVVGQGVWAQPETGQVQAWQSAMVAALVKRLTSTEVNWKERVSAQKELEKLPPLPVMLALVPEITKGMPQGGIWNGSGSAEQDAKLGAPAVWQVFYRVGEVWRAQDNRLGKDDRATFGRALVAYLPKAQGAVVVELFGYWVPEAEAPVAALFLNKATEASLRLEAMRCLLQNTGTKYLADAKKVTGSLPEQPWQQLLLKADFVDALIEFSRDRNVADKGQPDADILRLGFGLLPPLEKLKAGGGYELANTLGSYVGQKFSPDQNATKYQGEDRLTDAYFADTTKKALAWWERSRK